jgi:hypothetical protein
MAAEIKVINWTDGRPPKKGSSIQSYFGIKYQVMDIRTVVTLKELPQ